MKLLFKKIIADKIIKLSTYFACGIILAHLILLLFIYNFLPPYLPLFNQMPWGDDRLGIRIAIFIPVSLAFLFFSLNFYLAMRIYEKMPLLSRILNITGLLITILTFLFIIRIIRIII